MVGRPGLRRIPCVRQAAVLRSTHAMELPVILSPGEDGYLVAECPVIPGCISQGRTRAEALRNIREAIELCLGGKRRRVGPFRRLGVQRTLTRASS
jgi:predicted RNase H-like HicB family nuclease